MPVILSVLGVIQEVYRKRVLALMCFRRYRRAQIYSDEAILRGALQGDEDVMYTLHTNFKDGYYDDLWPLITPQDIGKNIREGVFKNEQALVLLLGLGWKHKDMIQLLEAVFEKQWPKAIRAILETYKKSEYMVRYEGVEIVMPYAQQTTPLLQETKKPYQTEAFVDPHYFLFNALSSRLMTYSDFDLIAVRAMVNAFQDKGFPCKVKVWTGGVLTLPEDLQKFYSMGYVKEAEKARWEAVLH
jgi:hypothetical protein